jgi:hypothetical protein
MKMTRCKLIQETVEVDTDDFEKALELIDAGEIITEETITLQDSGWEEQNDEA